MSLVKKKLGCCRCVDIDCELCPIALLDLEIWGYCCYEELVSTTLFEILNKIPFDFSKRPQALMFEFINSYLCDNIVEIEVKENA